MTTSLFLPFSQPADLFSAASPEPRLPRVRLVRRQGPALHVTPLAASGDVLGLDLTRDAVRPGDGVLAVYADTAECLARELVVRRPRAVFISPSADPFPPLNEVQAAAAEAVRVLAAHGVESWLLTRGLVRPAALEVLAAHRDRVKVTAAITTTDRALQRSLEPLAAPPRLRLRQVARLRGAGVPVQVSLDPLVPGVTDTRDNLSAVLAALAEVGVGQVTAGYLCLRRGTAVDLGAALGRLGEAVVGAFRGGPVLAAPGLAPARYLPKARRQRGYAALMALAAAHGIRVSVSALSNPDFGGPRRPEAGTAPPRLLSLFLQSGHREPA